MFKNNKEKDSNYKNIEELEQMYKFQVKNLESKIIEQQHKIDELVDYISARFGEDILNSNIGTKLITLEKTIKEIEKNYKTNLEKNTKSLKKEIQKEGQKIAADLSDAQTELHFKLLQKNENDMSKIKGIYEQQEDNKEKILDLDKIVKTHIKNNDIYQKEIREELKNTNQKIGKINYIGITSKFDKKLKEKYEKLDGKIDEVKNQTQIDTITIDEKFTQELGQLQENLQTNGEELIKLQEMFVNDSEKNNSKIENNTNRIMSLDEKLEEKIKKTNENLISTQNTIKETGEKLSLAVEEIKSNINQQITENYNQNKTELNNIEENIEDIKSSMDKTIEDIAEEISKLKEQIKENEANQNNEDVELLRKDYNKLVTKMNNELTKISKDLLNAQKKNLEQNRNLQVKIKSYIDNQIEKANNTKKVEELIDNLNLSILEREKVQKFEMEERFNKKLKAIQKENERMLNKKIEEISSKLIRENVAQVRQNPNNVTIYKETPKKKKSMYEPIDENQILKRSASSKNPTLPTKEGKSQILKFFYDDED